LKTEEGCDSIVTLNLDVIYYPFITAFSPFNKDGVNDYFMPGFKVQIFNRYGALIYETRTQEEQDTGWDGRNSKKQNVEPGLYFYILYNSGGKPRLKSSVEVLKR
jgi:gliding motility-associated-like protein